MTSLELLIKWRGKGDEQIPSLLITFAARVTLIIDSG